MQKNRQVDFKQSSSLQYLFRTFLFQYQYVQVFSLPSKQETSYKDNKSGKAEEDAEEFVPTAHFEPLVPLPALVETKTGEEDEKVYCFVLPQNPSCMRVMPKAIGDCLLMV